MMELIVNLEWDEMVIVTSMTQIDLVAPFAGAFREKSEGWERVSNVIGVGASFGILTSLLVSMLGQAIIEVFKS